MPRTGDSSPRVPHPRGGSTASLYRRGCRCSGCRAAWAEYARLRRERKKERLDQGLDIGVTHWTTSGYTEGCRCEKCSTAYRKLRRSVREQGGVTSQANDRCRTGSP